MSNKRLKEKIIRDIERSVKNASYEIALDMQKRYEYVIQAFYNDYSPNSYTAPNPLQRTGSLFLGSNGYSYSFDKNININKNANSIESTIKINVDSKNIIGEPHRTSNSWVFNRAFFMGIHGFTPAEYKDWVSRENHSPIMERAKVIPHKMKKSPESLMTSWFKKYKATEMPKIVDKYMHESGF